MCIGTSLRGEKAEGTLPGEGANGPCFEGRQEETADREKSVYEKALGQGEQTVGWSPGVE